MLEEATVPSERFWRLTKLMFNPILQTWRPRVHGTQLKAVQGARLPATEQEWQAVKAVIDSLQPWLKPDTTADAFLQDLKALEAQCRGWWESRNSVRGAGGSAAARPKRAISDSGQMEARGRSRLAHTTSEGPSSGGQYGMALAASGGFMDLMTSEQAAHVIMEAGMQQPGAMANADLSALAPCDVQAQAKRQCSERRLVSLCVGGHRYTTATTTLTAVEGSALAGLVCSPAPGHPAPQLAYTPLGDIFLDRNGRLFEFVLDYLRSVAAGEAESHLPLEAQDLQALEREAIHYRLPGLLERVQAARTLSHSTAGPSSSSSMPIPALRLEHMYRETGYFLVPAQQAALQQAREATLQDLANAIRQRESEGYMVVSYNPGSHVHTSAVASSQRDYYHVLLRKQLL
ncbi:hypothetical protein WJX72_008966 [[Myrmecia] bisecta]|uniref:Potassium channel tetramerisation-type BTB domain-containing protein n=1 Tax=[Myrmecia] bisecta TaxID=41462 RepID=A0AAW1Q4I6_9CHLO